MLNKDLDPVTVLVAPKNVNRIFNPLKIKQSLFSILPAVPAIF